jgi:hypothetical protein
MELNSMRVYLNNTLLKNNPLGLDTLKKTFVRDSELFGIYTVSSFDLIFVGDGYCILKDFQDDINSCDIGIKVQQYCNKSWVNVFDGVIFIGSISIDESLSQATCEIEDNSPLSLISKNSEISIDLESDFDVYGEPLATIPEYNTLFTSPDGVTTYDRKYFLWDDVFKLVLEAITGRSVNISSTFLSTTPTLCEWQMTLTGDMAQLSEIIVYYKDFQGNILKATTDTPGPTFTGNGLLTAIRYEMINQAVYPFPPYNNAQVKGIVQSYLDYRDFSFSSQDNATKSITLKSTLPIEIVSAFVVSTDPTATISFSKISDYIDGGDNPVFLNYRMVANQSSPYQFTVTFKELMENFNKLYNVYFVAKYNDSGGIDFIIENYDSFINIAPNKTIDNARNLKYSFSDEINSSISLSEKDDTTLATISKTLTSDFCKIGDTLDNGVDFVVGTNKFWTDLAIVYDSNYDNNIYIISNAATFGIQFIRERWGLFSHLYTIQLYNAFLTNYHRIYRHFNRFGSNIIGTSVVFRQSSNLNIENTSSNKLLKKYEFVASISNLFFDSLTDTIFDRIKFKKLEDVNYREGMITNVEYNYNTGEAEFTILGE